MRKKMRPDSRVTPQAPPALLSELAEHLKLAGNRISFNQALEECIRGWIDGDNAHQPPSAEPSRGYQWKTLFLPEATELRMESGDHTYHARVCGDQIIFGGRPVSPRGMTVAIAGEGRNAWRDLSLRLPGQRYFRAAMSIRREHERAPARPPESPAQTMAAAAAAMSDALKAALALAEHSKALAAPPYERRGSKHRRESDLLGETCNMD
jgi:hypothetical protein